MASLSSFSKVSLSNCARSLLIGFYCLGAVFLCEIVFPGNIAWCDGLTIYRDLSSGIYSNSDDIISYRYMRHIWATRDGVLAAVVQKGGYDGHGLVLYKSLDEGLHWEMDAAISDDNYLVSDGIIDSNNNILLVTSIISTNRTFDVNFIRLTYNSILRAWSIDHLTPATIFASGNNYRVSRATIAVDSNGVIWSAFRFEDIINGIFNIKVFYSVDGGSSWNDSGNSFGTSNNLSEKCAKVIAVGSRMALIYQDVKGTESAPESFKEWAYREDSQPLNAAWTSGSITKMIDTAGDPYGSHWSVAADDFANIHMSYEDNGIKYLKYDAAIKSWVGPRVAALDGGHYSNISVAANNDIYMFARNQTGKKIIVRRYSSSAQRWSKWVAVSSQDYDGRLRMSSPERFADHLPLLHQVNADPPYQLMYDLINTVPLN